MVLECRALLFDLDGTLIDSIASVDRAWSWWAQSHGMDPAKVLKRIHGRRSIDSVALLLPGCDAVAEDAKLRAAECSDTEGVVALPGALELLQQLPPHRWGIVTSGTSDVAQARLEAARVPKPGFLVCGDHVRVGKPDPEAFLLGAQGLGVQPADILGFEDTAAGVKSITSAGMHAIAMGAPIEGATFLGTFARLTYLGFEDDTIRLEIGE